MLKTIIASCFFLLSMLAKGQGVVSDPFSGKPYFAKVHMDIEGSVYLFEDWKLSYVTDKGGTTFLNVMTRFDAYENKFYYNHGDTAYEFVTEISEIELFPFPGDTINRMIFRKGFSINKDVTSLKYLQVLAEGKITALKYISKTVDERTEYSVATKIKSFTDRSTYFVIKDGVIISQKPGEKILKELTKDRWDAVESRMKQYSLNPKNEKDYILLIIYYNSLQATGM